MLPLLSEIELESPRCVCFNISLRNANNWWLRMCQPDAHLYSQYSQSISLIDILKHWDVSKALRNL